MALVDGSQTMTLELPYFLADIQIAREAYERRFETAARYRNGFYTLEEGSPVTLAR